MSNVLEYKFNQVRALQLEHIFSPTLDADIGFWVQIYNLYDILKRTLINFRSQ